MAAEIKLFGTRIVPAAPRDEKGHEEGGQAAVEAAKAAAAAVVGLPCPRCKSRETKFCYFNNYNVNQPRHFCRGCQRYWTAGGALRNVPVGAGRRRSRPPPHTEAAGPLLGYNQYQPAALEGAALLQQYWLVGHEGFPAKRPNNGINGLQERIC